MKKITSIFLFIICLIQSKSFAQSIAAFNNHSLAICIDGTVRAWGQNNYGQLGDTTIIDRSVPVQVGGGLNGVVALASGTFHSLAVKSDGTMRAWGHGNYGALGWGTNADSHIPVQVTGLTGAVKAAGGEAHSLALLSDGTIRSWGANVWGQLGIGTVSPSVYYQTPVTGITGATDVAAGLYFSLALKNDGTVWAWGCNTSYQLGDGTTTSHSIPVQVIGISGAVAVDACCNISIALKNDGTVWQWGGGSSAPVQVNGLSGIIATDRGIALKNDGTVWSWSTANPNGIPNQVTTLSGIAEICHGTSHSLALKNDGTLWAWGSNSWGQLGDSTVSSATTPIQPMGLCPMQVIITSANELNKSNSFSISPNPAFDELKIDNGKLKIEGVEIYNTLGEKVYSQQQTTSDKQQTVDVSQLLPGVYFVAVTDDKGNKITRKFIKM